jgi:hypothetical protein
VDGELPCAKIDLARKDHAVAVPKQIRRLVGTICIFWTPSSTTQVWALIDPLAGVEQPARPALRRVRQRDSSN